MAAATRRLFVTRPRVIVPLLVFLLLLILFFALTPVYTDLLFYRSVNFSKVFTTVLWTRVLLFVLFGAVMALAVGTNLVLAYKLRPTVGPLTIEQRNLERYRTAIEPYLLVILLAVSAVFGLVAGLSAAGRWRTWLLWVNGQPFGIKDPQFNRDISYYAFTYPFQRFLLGFLLTAVVISLLVAVITHYLFGGIRIQDAGGGQRVSPAAKAHLSVLLGLLALLKAWAYYLDRFGLVFSSRGVSTGASYTDVHAVLPAKLILLFISLACAVLFIYNIFQRGWTLPLLAAGILVLSSVVIGGIYPAIVQQFQVKPNEASREAPYIQRNIDATRQAYGIADIEPEAYDAAEDITAEQVAADTGTISNVRLLDPNHLTRTFRQKQQIRGYYGFPDSLDVDRYTIVDENGERVTRDYVVSARELDLNGLSERNWINDHLTYTHGRGFVAAPANTVVDGLPIFQEGNLPPVGPLDIDESRIYFGEMSPEYSIVGTRQPEIDGPAGQGQDDNTTSYDGSGGVSLGSSFNRLLFAIHFGDKNILFSSDITDDSRILYERNPRDRVQKVAPWLTLDGDPYPAVVDGRVIWIIDGYTASNGYPYSDRNTLGEVTADAVTGERGNRVQQAANQVNYIRNSVKATVDAYDGTVTLYAFDEEDPVLRTWMRAFPGTVRPSSEIPPKLREHFRYPEDLFKVQRDVLAEYHVTNPRDFYSQADFWSVSPDPSNPERDQPPFYVYSQLYGRDEPSFNLTTPLISRRSSKLAAYLAVSSDPDNYGQFQLLRLPQGVTIEGPAQIQNQIETNAAETLTLWRGGPAGTLQTIEGNLLTLPVAGGLVYIEPYYVVQANSATGFPTLRGVAVAYGNKVALAESLQDALDEVFGPGAGAAAAGAGTGGGGGGGEEPTTPPQTPPATPPEGGESPPPSPPTGGGGELDPALRQAILDAQAAATASEEALSRNPPDWVAYGEAQKNLADALARMREFTAAPEAPTTGPPETPATSPNPSPG
ncbi:MAG: UPF0182 family protein [Frankia sp.]|nr:UPF0182 family protein [Frankia sp.]